MPVIEQTCGHRYCVALIRCVFLPWLLCFGSDQHGWHRYCLASSLGTPVLKLDCVLKAHEIPKRVRGECAQSHRFVVLYRVMVLRVAKNMAIFQVLVQFPRWSVNGSVLVSSFRTHTTLVFTWCSKTFMLFSGVRWFAGGPRAQLRAVAHLRSLFLTQECSRVVLRVSRCWK